MRGIEYMFYMFILRPYNFRNIEQQRHILTSLELVV